MEWQQSSTSLYFSGASRYIRLYDLNKETKIVDMMTGSEGVVTSMCCDSLTQSRLVGSFSDGSVRVFDRRLPPHDRYANVCCLLIFVEMFCLIRNILGKASIMAMYGPRLMWFTNISCQCSEMTRIIHLLYEVPFEYVLEMGKKFPLEIGHSVNPELMMHH